MDKILFLVALMCGIAACSNWRFRLSPHAGSCHPHDYTDCIGISDKCTSVEGIINGKRFLSWNANLHGDGWGESYFYKSPGCNNTDLIQLIRLGDNRGRGVAMMVLLSNTWKSFVYACYCYGSDGPCDAFEPSGLNHDARGAWLTRSMVQKSSQPELGRKKVNTASQSEPYDDSPSHLLGCSGFSEDGGAEGSCTLHYYGHICVWYEAGQSRLETQCWAAAGDVDGYSGWQSADMKRTCGLARVDWIANGGRSHCRVPVPPIPHLSCDVKKCRTCGMDCFAHPWAYGCPDVNPGSCCENACDRITGCHPPSCQGTVEADDTSP